MFQNDLFFQGFLQGFFEVFYFFPVVTMYAYGFFVQKVLTKDLNFWHQGVKNQKKIKALLMISILKVDMKTVTLFFRILYSLMPKIEIFIKFLEAAIVFKWNSHQKCNRRYATYKEVHT